MTLLYTGALLSVLVVVLLLIIFFFARSISKPIGSLYKITQKLKQKENKKDKEKVIESVKVDSNFVHINEQY